MVPIQNYRGRGRGEVVRVRVRGEVVRVRVRSEVVRVQRQGRGSQGSGAGVR